jgi:hypothetical protein
MALPVRQLARDVGPHVVAIGATTLLVAAVPIVAYGLLVVIGIVAQGDPGGWLNFIIVPIGSLLLGLCCAVAFAPLSVIALRLGTAAILTPIAVVLLAFGAWEIGLGGLLPPDNFVFHVIGCAVALLLGAAFLVYLSALVISRRILGGLFTR